MSTATATGARTARATGKNAPTMTARIGTRHQGQGCTDYTDDADTICNVCGYERTVTPPAPAEYTITVTSGGNGTASTSHAKSRGWYGITLTATPNTGYHFKVGGHERRRDYQRR